MRKTLFIVLLAGVLAGCTSYEYQLLEPTKAARRIVYHSDETISLPPLVYVMRCYENHLIMRIENPGGEPIGDESVVVSPDGQSHPLRRQTIAAHSFIKLIFPPVPPAPEPSGPEIGI